MDPIKPNTRTTSERLGSILAQGQFEGLKAILDRVSTDPEKLGDLVLGATTYSELLKALGYQLTIVRQIHVQGCYERVGVAGGIKAVLPYYDTTVQSSLPTLVNLDGTVTATPKSVAFFESLFLELKSQLQRQA
jgi:hypothetical protein